jgi:hypothetical protein
MSSAETGFNRFDRINRLQISGNSGANSDDGKAIRSQPVETPAPSRKPSRGLLNKRLRQAIDQI